MDVKPRKPNRHERRALAAIARSPEKSAKLRAAQELQAAAKATEEPGAKHADVVIVEGGAAPITLADALENPTDT